MRGCRLAAKSVACAPPRSWGKLLSPHSEEVALVVPEGSSSYSKAGSDGNIEVD